MLLSGTLLTTFSPASGLELGGGGDGLARALSENRRSTIIPWPSTCAPGRIFFRRGCVRDSPTRLV
jgi:hypothetical protein